MNVSTSTRLAALLFTAALLTAAHCVALERITFRRDSIEQQLLGRTVVRAQDGVLFETRDSVLWTIPDSEKTDLSGDEMPFTPLAHKELGAALLKDLPAGFETFETKHYLICFNTSRAYAQWCGS